MADYIVKITDLDCVSLLDDVFETICVKSNNATSNKFQIGLDKKLPEVIFYFCQSFELAPEASFFAVELFHGFTRKYIQQYSKQKEKMGLYCSKSTLYILVCIQISSKMSSHYKAIPQRCIINHLNHIHGNRLRHISKRDVLMAELEILQTVNYDLNFLLPIDIIDIMLYFVQNWLEESYPKALKNCCQLKKTCSSILEMVYLRQHQILIDFGKDTVQQSACSQMLLSIAVICVAVFIVDDDLSEVIAVFMADKCNTDHTALLKLSVCIIENIYNNNTNRFR